MRLSQLAGREIVDLADGARLGLFGDADLSFDPETGQIHALEVTLRGGLPWPRRAPIRLPWSAVRRVGPEVVLVESGPPEAGAGTRGR